MQIVKPYVKQEKWGHPAPYADYIWVPYAPEMYVLHWGGGPYPYKVSSRSRSDSLFRGWRTYHINKGWRDIAYNLGAGYAGQLHRLRGLNQNGAHKNSTYWGRRTLAVVFQVTHGETPARRSRRAFARQHTEFPLPVTGHGLLPEQTTQCPGPWLLDYIEREGWFNDLGKWKIGDVSKEVRSVRRRLRDLGYMKRAGMMFNRKTENAILEFRRDNHLDTDKLIIEPKFLKALSIAKRKEEHD